VAQRLYDIAALEPLIRDGYTFLTPNQRLARRIKLQWDTLRAAAGDRAWQPLPVHTLEDWLLRRWSLAISLGGLPPATLLSSAQTLELWRQIIVEHREQTSHVQLLLPAVAAELAQQARDLLKRWQVDVTNPAVRQWFMLDRDCATFWHWLRSFERRLEQSALCTPADCLAQLPVAAGHLPAVRVVLLEFDDIPPLLDTALNAVCSQAVRFAAPGGAARRIAHPFNSHRDELQAVAAWAAGLHRAEPTTTVGIVPGDMYGDRLALEYLLRREFDCLGGNYNSLPVNFSTGTPLAQVPLVRDALAVLAMGLPQTTVTSVVNVLHSRFLDVKDARSELPQRLINGLFATGRETITVRELRRIARQCSSGDEHGLRLGQHLQALSNRRELRRSAPPSTWATQLGDVLALWGWPGPGLDSVEHQQLALWLRTLDELRAFDAVCGVIDYSQALTLLRDCCTRQVSHPQSADSPIQVLGPLEAAGLAFDHLWLCGMQAASWPAPPRPNPFIPLSLQSRLRMPHADPNRELAFSTALLERYARASRTLHASYARQDDGIPHAPSALLAAFEEQAMPAPPAPDGTAECEPVSLETVTDFSAPRLTLVERAGLTGGSRVLEDQSQCPFRAFARHRLRIATPVAPASALPPNERGVLLHAALHALWGELGNLATLRAMTATRQMHTVENAIETAFASVPAATKRRAGAAYWHLERQRLAGLLGEWLAVERERSEFSVIERETAIALELGELPLRLRIDRVDQMPDGARVVIDYKSGNCSVRDWLGDRPARPQLLLYAVAGADTAAALAFARVKRGDCGFAGLGRIAVAQGIRTELPQAGADGEAMKSWDALNLHWRATLERLAVAFVQGEAPVDPRDASACSHCGLQPLCRVGSLTADSEALER